MPLDMTQFHEVFFDETAEHLSTMESLLLYLNPEDPDPEQLEDLIRAAHSIKGSSGTFGFQEMAGLAQEIEARMARVRNGQERLSAERASDLQEACAALRALLARCRGEGGVSQEATAGDTPPAAPDLKVSFHSTAKPDEEGADALQELARRTSQENEGPPRAFLSPSGGGLGAARPWGRSKAMNDVMALVEAAGCGGLGEVTEAVRALGDALEQNAALVERAAENAASLQESFRTLVHSIAGLALSPPGRSAGRLSRPRPLPKVRRAGGKAWPEY